MIYGTYLGVKGVTTWVSRHPKTSLALAVTSAVGVRTRKEARRSGLCVSQRPYTCLLSPPLPFVAEIIAQLPESAGTNGLGEASAMGNGGKKGRRLPGGVERVAAEKRVGRGQEAYKCASAVLRRLSAWDGMQDASLYCSQVSLSQLLMQSFSMRHQVISRRGGVLSRGRTVRWPSLWCAVGGHGG
jgi:hypothetical protein